jgi:hypothetical protein
MSTHTDWRCVLRVHEAAELLPRMNKAELEELGKDIKKRGLQSPVTIITDADGGERLLDSINRLDSMEMVGLPIVKDGELNPELVQTHNVAGNVDPRGYVLSANLLRRHLTNEQKTELIAKLLKLEPNQSNRTIAKQVKADHKTVGTVRDKLEATGEIPQLKKTIGADGKDRKRPVRKSKPKPAVTPEPDLAEAPEVEQEKEPTEQSPEDSLATRIEGHFDRVLAALNDESIWPALNASRKKRVQKALKKLKGVCRELIELAKPAPRRGRPPKARAS